MSAKSGGTFPKETYLLEILDEVGTVVSEIPLAGYMNIGRGSPELSQDLLIPAECRSASRHHALIDLRGDQPILTDASRYGTIVNGNKLTKGSRDLLDRDQIIFGLPADGWRVRFRWPSAPHHTVEADPMELLTVSMTPREVRIGRLKVEEQLGDRAFRLLKFLVDNKGKWYPVDGLAEKLWTDSDDSPYQADQALSRFKKTINDLLRPHLKGQDAIESWPHRGYKMKSRLEGS